MQKLKFVLDANDSPHYFLSSEYGSLNNHFNIGVFKEGERIVGLHLINRLSLTLDLNRYIATPLRRVEG